MKIETQPKVDYTPADLDEVSRQLLGAAQIIEDQGFWNGVSNSAGKSTGKCAVLAIQDANKHGSWIPACERLADSIGLPRGGLRLVSEVIYAWNDSHTKDEVIAKLRAVALGL